MIDQSNINLLDLVSTNTHLNRVSNTEGGEYQGPCPFCGGKDRFVVQPDHSNNGRWFCRQCTPPWQDAIAYAKRIYPALSFKEVCDILGIQLEARLRNSSALRPQRTFPTESSCRLTGSIATPPSKVWQQRAKTFFSFCTDVLWSKSGTLGREYLRDRGLVNADILRDANIGYNPASYSEKWDDATITLPRGIVIPWVIEHQVWGLNVRDMDWNPGKPNKYRRATGSKNAIYGVQQVKPRHNTLMVETELDALVIQQVLSGIGLSIVPIATGSIQWGRQYGWLARIAIAKKVFVAFDLENVPAKIVTTEAAATWWLDALKPNAKRIFPTKHDITDMLVAGDDILAWIRTAIAS